MRYITIVVIDKKGNPVSGVNVKKYGDKDATRTNKEGKALIEADSSSVTIYVKGFTVYDGYTSKCPNPLIYTTG